MVKESSCPVSHKVVEPLCLIGGKVKMRDSSPGRLGVWYGEMIKEDHKINGLQQSMGFVAIIVGALFISLGAYLGVLEAAKPKTDPNLAQVQGKKDLIVARVNGYEIRLSDVIMARQEMAPDDRNLPEPLVLETIINDLIDRRLFAEAGWKAGLTKDNTVQGRMQFEENKLLSDSYVASLVEEYVSERDIKQLYKERYLDPAALREVHLWQILVRSEEEAIEVIAALEEGAYFGDLARQYSNDAFAVKGGDMGYVSAEELLPAVAEVAFGLKEGAISGAFQSSFGWHVLYIQDRRMKEPVPLIAVRDALRKELLEQAMEHELQRLRERAKIERVQPPLQAKLDRAMIAAQ